MRSTLIYRSSRSRPRRRTQARICSGMRVEGRKCSDVLIRDRKNASITEERMKRGKINIIPMLTHACTPYVANVLSSFLSFALAANAKREGKERRRETGESSPQERRMPIIGNGRPRLGHFRVV